MLDKNRAIKRGQRQIKRGNTSNAISAYLKALKIDNDDPNILLRLAVLFRQQKKFDKAVHYYKMAARNLTVKGYFTKAISIYKQILEIESKKKIHKTYFNLAELYYSMSETENALKYYKKLVIFYENEDRLDDALGVMQRMHDLDSGNNILSAKLSDLYFKNGMNKKGYLVIKPVIESYKESGNDEEYLTLLEKVSESYPENVDNLRELSNFLIEHDCPSLAFKTFDKIDEYEVSDLKFINRFSKYANENQCPESLLQNIEDIKSRFSDSGVVIAKKESFKTKTQKPENVDAEKESESSEKAGLYADMKKPEKAKMLYIKLADFSEKAGRVDDAIEIREKILALDPEDTLEAAKLSDLYFAKDMKEEGYRAIKPILGNLRESGNHKHYRHVLEKMARVYPENTSNLIELADYYQKNNYPLLAFKTLDKIISLDPYNIDVLRKSAYLAESQGFYEQAQKNLKALLSLHENNGELELANSISEEIIRLSIVEESEETKAEENMAEAKAEVETEIEIDDTELADLDIYEEDSGNQDVEYGRKKVAEQLLDLPISEFMDCLNLAKMEARFDISEDVSAFLRINITDNLIEVKSSIKEKGAEHEAEITEGVISKLEDIVSGILKKNRQDTAGKTIGKLFGIEPHQFEMTERISETKNEDGDDSSQTSKTMITDHIEGDIFEDQFVDLYEIKKDDKPYDVSLLFELEHQNDYDLAGYIKEMHNYYKNVCNVTKNADFCDDVDGLIQKEISDEQKDNEEQVDFPEGYKLDEHLEKLIKFFGAKYKSLNNQELSEKDQALMENNSLDKDLVGANDNDVDQDKDKRESAGLIRTESADNFDDVDFEDTEFNDFLEVLAEEIAAKVDEEFSEMS
jgi:tetratricopeptide (TPR) repeat protein